jgi:transposase-like protein
LSRHRPPSSDAAPEDAKWPTLSMAVALSSRVSGTLQHAEPHEADIEIRRIKYLNNIVEQDHRAVKRVTRPMLGFKSFRSAAATLSGIELMHMIRKGQSRARGKLRPAQQFYALVA